MAGIRGHALQLFQSYLSNRKLIISANGSLSAQRDITVGVPQGSVLGSIMYLIYVNDMGQLNLSGDLYLYADDSSVFYANETTEQNVDCMKPDIGVINEYYRINKLSLNTGKTKFVHFTTVQKKIDTANIVDVDGVIIERTNVIKYLGLNIDAH